MNKQNFYVYCFICTLTGKSYVGWTSKTIEKRWEKHISNAKSGSKYYFHRAIMKYGLENWKKTILEIVNTEKQAKYLEKRWIKRCKSFNPIFGYNSSFGGESCIPTKETRLKLSISQKKRYQDPEQRRKVGIRTNKISEETREKLRLSKLGSKNPQFGKVSSHRKPVNCYNLDGTFVASYSSIKIAANLNNFNRCHISQVCRGIRNHHMNFIWKFKL